MLKIGTTDLPTPKSVTYTQNKLWSQNTGRLDSGYFVGDLIAIKKKYQVTFPALTPTELATVRAAVNADFATVQITNAEGGTDTVSAYFGDVTVESYSWHNGINYAINAAVSIIER
jgi:ribosomal protein L18